MSGSSSDSDEIEIEEEETTKSAKLYKERVNFGIENFREKFRFTPESFEQLLLILGPELAIKHENVFNLNPKQQLLTALRFYASNSFYHVVRDAHGPSKSTICRCIKRVTRAIVLKVFPNVVRWPPTQEERRRISHAFYQKPKGVVRGLPNVCGAVDGTLINIKSPKKDEVQFVDRKGGHSLNVMAVAGPDFIFYYVNAKWPGSVSDARVLRNSKLAWEFESGWEPFSEAYLLGDSIYPLRSWIVPPVDKATLTESEKRFNCVHRKTRFVVENSFGILKNRFACLRGLRVKTPEYSGQIILACFALHNLLIKELPPEEEEIQEPDEPGDETAQAQLNAFGLESEADSDMDQIDPSNTTSTVIIQREEGKRKLAHLVSLFE